MGSRGGGRAGEEVGGDVMEREARAMDLRGTYAFGGRSGSFARSSDDGLARAACERRATGYPFRGGRESCLAPLAPAEGVPPRPESSTCAARVSPGWLCPPRGISVDA